MNEVFSYSDQNRRFLNTFYLFPFITGMFLFCGLTASLASRGENLGWGSIFQAMPGYILGETLCWGMACIFLNIHHEFKLTSEGVCVRYFLFSYVWSLIRWEQITSIKPLPQGFQIGLPPYGFPIWVVQFNQWPRKDMAIAHWFVKVFEVNAGTAPSFLIHPALERQDELVNAIRERIGSIQEQN